MCLTGPAALPLGLGFTIATRLHPALSFGLVLGAMAWASTSELSPFGTLTEALRLFEWNSHDAGLLVSEAPRAALGLALGLLRLPGASRGL